MDCRFIAGFLICGPIASGDGATSTKPPSPPPPLIGQMQSCWNIPPRADQATVEAIELDVTFDVDGNPVSIAGVRPSLSGLAAKIEESAVRAIERCSPYQGTEPRTYRVVFDPSGMF